MTKEIIDYLTKAEMKTGKETKHSEGLRPQHTDFVNNDESQGYRVTFVNGVDDPYNSPENVAEQEAEEAQRTKDKELKDKTKGIGFNDMTKEDQNELIARFSDAL